MSDTATELETTLGHAFRDKGLLKQALTHASVAGKRSNERLEFLGDRVLGLVIARELIKRFPDAVEGHLAVRLNALVRQETCARIAKKVGLGNHLILATGERQTGGHAKAAVLGDACEAVIAALFLDGGLEAAERFVLKAWADDLSASAHTERDPKTVLQEWAQSRSDLGRSLPEYRTIRSTGPSHAPHFEVEAEVKGAGSATGEGKSKRDAEREAARHLLSKLKVSP